jgi:hypothetical protein
MHPKSLTQTHAERPYWNNMDLYENEGALRAFILSWAVPGLLYLVLSFTL